MNILQKTKRCLESVGYMTSDILAAQISLLLTQIGVKAMILDGPPGSGKTFLAKSVAGALGVEYVYIQAHPGSMPEDFLFDLNLPRIMRAVSGGDPIKHDHDVYEYGFLPTIFELSQKEVVVAFVDELDKASPKVDSLFLSALQEGEVLVKGRKIKCNPDNLILFLTKNDEREISEPLMRRCRRHYLYYPSPAMELKILADCFQELEYSRLPIQKYPDIMIPESVAKEMIFIAAILRKNDKILKPPCTAELYMACQDILKLVKWDISTDNIASIISTWLVAYNTDRQKYKESDVRTRLTKLISHTKSLNGRTVSDTEVRILLGQDWVSFNKEIEERNSVC